MKIEISYKNSLIGSLSAGESLALHLNGSKLTEDLIVRAVGDAVEESVPTDLTGYTVTVPGGWTASAGYGSFSIEGDVTYYNVTQAINSPFYIGYGIVFDEFPKPREQANLITDFTASFSLQPSVSFSLSNITGSDVDNYDLIRWLVDNNATFEKTA